MYILAVVFLIRHLHTVAPDVPLVWFVDDATAVDVVTLELSYL